jgi:hypothetical protein
MREISWESDYSITSLSAKMDFTVSPMPDRLITILHIKMKHIFTKPAPTRVFTKITKGGNHMEQITIQLKPLIYDRLHTLAVEFSVTTTEATKNLLVNIAVKRLLDDVELVRNLRAGKFDLE